MQQLIQHRELGAISIHKSPKALQYKLSVKPDGTIVLTIPRGGNLDRGLQFAEQKKEWLRKAQCKIEHFAPATSRFGIPSSLQFGNIHIGICAHQGPLFRLRKQDNASYTLFCPEAADENTAEVQNKLRSIVIEIFRKEAHLILPERLLFLSRKYDLPFSDSSIKKMSTRWGSCSTKNSIHLNLHLIRLPQILCDYILLHELAHTRFKDHGPTFHEFLNKLTDGRSKEWAKELKKHHPDRF